MKTASMNIHIPVLFTTKSERVKFLTIYCQCLTVLNHKPIIKPKVSLYKPLSNTEHIRKRYVFLVLDFGVVLVWFL